MQAKRFWPPTKHKLLYANIVVYAVTLVLAVVFSHDLMWAQEALRNYVFTGTVQSSRDRQLLFKATKYLKEGQDTSVLQSILAEAVQIDPYSEAQLFLGNCYAKQGDEDKMFACYDKYRSINPSVIGVYLAMINILEKKQDHKAAEQLADEAIRHFRRRVELYQPHLDPDVIPEFNAKAQKVYDNSKKALAILEKVKVQLGNSK